jgi:hypothetical protein
MFALVKNYCVSLRNHFKDRQVKFFISQLRIETPGKGRGFAYAVREPLAVSQSG